MTASAALAPRRALALFFALAYLLSWGFWLLAAKVRGFPMLFPFGSVLAALIVAGFTEGRAGLVDILKRAFRWRVGLRSYAAAFLVPLAIGLSVVALNVLLGAPIPTAAQLGPWYALLLLFPEAMMDAPLQEEIGWRGYAMPRFSTERSPLANSLLLGVLVAGWHLPVALSEPSISAAYLIAAIASMVVTNWVYYNARESAFLAILYHSTANTIGIYYGRMVSGDDQMRYYWLLAAVNIAVAVTLVLLTGPTLGVSERDRRLLFRTRL